ncbi:MULTISPECIES: YceI family protein [unclassified Meridianimarinicoccus]|uniref:YceI family protein n=1 Tax=unclassified Meridianimarinicoccus TaxID=2923344 RepID=UPI001866F9C1|nr:YceI family protein [Fluviibacterium sp. MJW13]
MKRLALLALATVLPLTAQADMARYTLDRDHVVVAFLVDHIGYANVLGRFPDVSGGFDFDPDTKVLGAVEVTIGAASVQTDHDARDGHVRSQDFLSAEAHPTFTFTADGGTPITDTTGTVTGTLTLRGVSQPLTLDVTLNQVADYPFGHSKQTVGISARGMVKRSEFGMDYGVANGLVGDEVYLIIEAEGVLQD